MGLLFKKNFSSLTDNSSFRIRAAGASKERNNKNKCKTGQLLLNNSLSSKNIKFLQSLGFRIAHKNGTFSV